MALRKAIGQAIFKLMVPEMASAAEMMRRAKKLGGSYRKTEMLADIREYTGRLKYQYQITRLSGDSAVPKSYMNEVKLKEPGANYQVWGKASFYDQNTGETYDHTVSFYHDTWKEKDEYASDFWSYFKNKYKEEGVEMISFEQFGLDHNIGKPY